MLSGVINIAFSVSTFSLITLDRVLKNVTDTTEMSSILYYFVHSLIYRYPPCDWQSTLMRVINKTILFYKKVLFYSRSNSNISNLYNLDQNLILASQTISDHIFAYPNSDHIFHVFGYELGLYFLYYIICKLTTYFEDGELLEYNVSLFLIKSNQL